MNLQTRFSALHGLRGTAIHCQSTLVMFALFSLLLAPAGHAQLEGSAAVVLHDSQLDASAQWTATRADLDGDGAPDLILGLPDHDRDSGRVIILYGPDSEWPDRIDLNALPEGLAHEFRGELPGDRMGHAVLALTREEGPHQAKLLIGAPGARNPDGFSGSGSVYVIHGPDKLNEYSTDMLDGQSGYRLLAGSRQDGLGSNLVRLGDESGLPVVLSAFPWNSLFQDVEPPYRPVYWPVGISASPMESIGHLAGLSGNRHRQRLADGRKFLTLPNIDGHSAAIISTNPQTGSVGLALEFHPSGLIGTAPQINFGDGIADQYVLAGELMTLDFVVSDTVDPPELLSVNASFLSTPLLIDFQSLAVSGTGAIRTLVAQTVTGFPDGSEGLEVSVTNSQGVDAIAPFQVFVLNSSTPEINGGLGLADETVNSGDLLEIPFTATDLLFDSESLTYQATSSNQTLLPDSALVLGGDGPDRLLSIQTVPGQAGQTAISLMVTNPNGQSAIENFLLTIQGTGPVINAGNGIPDATVFAGEALTLDFTVSDPDFLPSDIAVFAQSGNQALLPDTALEVTGTAGLRTLFINTSAGIAGQTLIDVVATNPNTLANSESFVLTIIQPSGGPEINNGAGIDNQFAVAGETLNVPFQVSDPIDPPQDLMITAQSNNPGVISNASLTLTGTAENRALIIQTTPGQTGIAGITVEVTNLNGQTALASFTVSVIERSPPLINFGQGIPDQTVTAGDLVEINLSVSDAFDPPGNLQLTAESLSPDLVPDNALQLLGTGTSRILRIATEADRTGVAEFRLTLVNSAGLSTQARFNLEITVPDGPIINNGQPLPDRTIPSDQNPRIDIVVRDSDGQPGDIELRVFSTDQDVLPDAALSLESDGLDWVLEIDTSLGRPGTTLIVVEARHPDGGVSQTSFELTITAASTELAIGGHPMDQQIDGQQLARLIIENTGEHSALQLQVTLVGSNELEVTGTWSQASGCWANDSEVGCEDLAGAEWRCQDEQEIRTCRVDELPANASAVLIVAVRTAENGQLQVNADADNADLVTTSFNPGD